MITTMRIAVLMLSMLLSACVTTGGTTPSDKRSEIESMRQQVLTDLFAEKPYVKQQINTASGYAIFSNANVNLLFIAAGGGYGVVKNNRTGKSTYMNMAEGGVGLGLGAKDYRLVIVFHTRQALDQFIESGWAFGGNADAAAVAGDKGDSIQSESLYGDVSVYTLTENGLALQSTFKGAKFWKDSELN